MTRTIDPHAIDGKFPAPATRFDVVVVGAGRSGTAAALTAAQAGQSVLLVDENPVPGHQIGNDVPLYFGGRATAATQNSERMLETLFMNTPDLEAVIEAGVELLLGTCAWGVYRNGPLVGSLPGQVVALADGERSWLVGFDRLVLATGARDLPMAFPGWSQPGVMGAAALKKLLTRYDAFAGKRVLIAGSHDLALETALLAHAKGLDVAGLIEVRDAPQGAADLVAQVEAAGIAIHCGVHPVEAKGGIDGVERVILSDGSSVDCDTLVMAIGLVPMIELADALGSARTFDAKRGGHIPLEDGAITAVGSCAGLADTGFDHSAYRFDWLNALGGACGGDTIICQCEEVTLSDLLGVQPPRYLERSPIMQARSLKSLLEDGPPNQDQIKRLTRSGMGACQGRRCRDQVAMMLAVEAGSELAALPLATHRAPVRPLPLKIIADWEESEEMRAGWDVWMGIPTQWVPYADIGTPYEEENRRVLGGNMSL
ncbi:MAG: FAD-dependent oxidoreductase [Sphingomonadales bacterium]|nr:FAD-dependent oxidoreductase [Sphingomonadales bacterium]